LRFDYYGEGDSDGDFEESDDRNPGFRHNFCYEILEGKNKHRKNGPFGDQIRGDAAALAAVNSSEVNELVLWAPILRRKRVFV